MNGKRVSSSKPSNASLPRHGFPCTSESFRRVAALPSCDAGGERSRSTVQERPAWTCTDPLRGSGKQSVQWGWVVRPPRAPSAGSPAQGVFRTVCPAGGGGKSCPGGGPEGVLPVRTRTRGNGLQGCSLAWLSPGLRTSVCDPSHWRTHLTHHRGPEQSPRPVPLLYLTPALPLGAYTCEYSLSLEGREWVEPTWLLLGSRVPKGSQTRLHSTEALSPGIKTAWLQGSISK